MTPELVYYPPSPSPATVHKRERERERRGCKPCHLFVHSSCWRAWIGTRCDREVVKISRDARSRGKTRRNPRLKCQSSLDGTLPASPFFSSSRECASLTRTKGETPRNGESASAGERVTDFAKSGKARRDFPRVSSVNPSSTRL